MARHCHVYRNPSKQTRARVPFLLVVQADLLSTLDSRAVVPLVAQKYMGQPLSRLHPRFTVDNQTVVMATADIAAIPTRLLSELVADLTPHRAEILAALDYLITGS